MSSSTQSSLERVKAQTAQLGRVFESGRERFRTVVKEHETQIDSLKRSFESSQQSIIRAVEDTLKSSIEDRDVLKRALQEEQQRVIDLRRKLHKAENDNTANRLAVETINHSITKDSLAESKRELAEAKHRIASLENDSKTATQRISVLQKDYDVLKGRGEELTAELDAVKERKIRLETELELRRREPASLRLRLKAVEQRNINLESVLRATAQRASIAEDKLKAFNSMVKQINDGTTTLASSSEQQPDLLQGTPSTPAPIKLESVEPSEPRQPTDDSLVRPQGLDPKVGGNMIDKNSDLLHCERILDQVMGSENWEFNRFFLKTMDSLTLASRDAKVGPLNLNTLKEKLVAGAYTSVICFQKDFDDMIADARTLNTPQNTVRLAAEKLNHIFYQAYSSQKVSGHEPQETARPAQGLNVKKRKAGTVSLVSSEDGHDQKRRSVASLDQSTSYFRVLDPGTGGSLGPTSPSPGQSMGNNPEKIDASRVVRKITAGKRLDIEATLSCVAQLVSFDQSPSTLTGDWKSLLPQEYRITKHTTPSDVEKRISYLVRDDVKKDEVWSDVIVLRLMPAAESDKPEFDRIVEYLHEKKVCAAVSSTGIDKVESIDLVPASKECAYPEFFSALDFDLLPPATTENVLFMAVVFCVAKDKQRQVRNAWSKRMAAIRNHEKDGLTAMCSVLARSPLHVFKKSRMILTSAKHHWDKRHLLPLTGNVAPTPELRALGEGVARLSYILCDKKTIPIVHGVRAPRYVFMLGLVNELGKSHGLIVVDVRNKDRPLWLLRRCFELDNPLRRTITLLADKFPRSFNDWQEVIPERFPTVTSNDKCLKNTGVKLERCFWH